MFLPCSGCSRPLPAGRGRCRPSPTGRLPTDTFPYRRGSGHGRPDTSPSAQPTMGRSADRAAGPAAAGRAGLGQAGLERAGLERAGLERAGLERAAELEPVRSRRKFRAPRDRARVRRRVRRIGRTQAGRGTSAGPTPAEIPRTARPRQSSAEGAENRPNPGRPRNLSRSDAGESSAHRATAPGSGRERGESAEPRQAAEPQPVRRRRKLRASRDRARLQAGRGT